MGRASDNGLEVAWWVVSGTDTEIAEALQEYLPRPLPMDPGVAALWEANGLRVVTIPARRLEAVQSRLAMIGAIQRQWLGQAGVWTDAITGPSWSGSRTIALDSGRLALGPGSLRLLTRCWTVPVPVAASEADPSPAAALHIELLIQHKERDGLDRTGSALDMPTRLDPLDDGLVFRRLLAELTVSEGDVYLILPYPAGVEWGGRSPATPEPEPESAAEPNAEPSRKSDTEPVPRLGEVRRAGGGDLSASPAAREKKSGESIGPPGVQVMSLGEALLTTQGVRPPTTNPPEPSDVYRPDEAGEAKSWRAERPARAMLLLIPRVPDRFRLIE